MAKVIVSDSVQVQAMNSRIGNPSHIRQLNLDVQLLYHPIGLISAVAHWISEEMIHVDTGRVVLEQHSEVEVTFPLRRDGHTSYHRIVALVSHREAGKTLLRFVRCSREAHMALRELLAGAAPA